MPAKETYEAEALELEKDRNFWKARALAAEGILATREASRARRDKRRAAKLKKTVNIPVPNPDNFKVEMP